MFCFTFQIFCFFESFQNFPTIGVARNSQNISAVVTFENSRGKITSVPFIDWLFVDSFQECLHHFI